MVVAVHGAPIDALVDVKTAHVGFKRGEFGQGKIMHGQLDGQLKIPACAKAQVDLAFVGRDRHISIRRRDDR